MCKWVSGLVGSAQAATLKMLENSPWIVDYAAQATTWIKKQIGVDIQPVEFIWLVVGFLVVLGPSMKFRSESYNLIQHGRLTPLSSPTLGPQQGATDPPDIDLGNLVFPQPRPEDLLVKMLERLTESRERWGNQFIAMQDREARARARQEAEKAAGRTDAEEVARFRRRAEEFGSVARADAGKTSFASAPASGPEGGGGPLRTPGIEATLRDYKRSAVSLKPTCEIGRVCPGRV